MEKEIPKNSDVILSVSRHTPDDGVPATIRMLKNKYRPEPTGIHMGEDGEMIGFDTTFFLMLGINGPGFMRDAYLREETKKVPMIDITKLNNKNE